jgi:hypothetical protein
MSWRSVFHLCWLLGFSADAWAWGLQTHAFFAQSLLWLVPLADPRLRRAAASLPRLVLAGAVLPDLVLTGAGRIPALAQSHDWETAARLFGQAGSDEERALALGFASHLLTDIFAHNHFVPAHEKVWFDVPLLTHAAAEWALDHRIAGDLFVEPAELVTRQLPVLGSYVAQSFSGTPEQAESALASLALAERWLRRSGLPALAYRTARLADRRLDRRFRHYLAHTARQLAQINRLAAGDEPRWGANPCPRRAKAALSGVPERLLRARLPLPADVFAPASG